MNYVHRYANKASATLKVGAGTGRYSIALASEGMNVTAVELVVHYFCIVADNPVSRFINGNTAAFVLYGITMAGVFAVRAFYEKDPEVASDIRKNMGQYLSVHAAKKLQSLDPGDFIPGIDLQMMYKEMYWASEGCLWEYIQRGYMNVDAMEKDFRKLLAFWKKVYLRKKKEGEGI